MVDYSGLIRKYEGLRLKSYPDSLHGWKTPTIGYGTVEYSNGHKVRKGDRITQEKAEAELNYYINRRIIPTLSRSIPTWGKMNDYQKEAIISFAYNLGEYFYGSMGFKTITRALSTTSNWWEVPDSLELYRNPGSKVEAGLLRRRKEEGKLWGKKPPTHEEEIPLIKVAGYYKGLPHQKEALLWLTKQYSVRDRAKLAREWNPHDDIIYSFDTYCKYYTGRKVQKEVLLSIQAQSARYSEEFFQIWRQEVSLVRKIEKFMKDKGYQIATNPGEINIVYIESKDFVPDTFNDVRIVFWYDSGVPKIVGKWAATTTPGRHYTKNPLNARGAAMVKPGQQFCWVVGHHKNSSHPALVQEGGPITIYRDFNRDFKREGEKEYSGYYGINQHSTRPGYSGKVGKWSAGCLVGADWDGHIRFMSLVKSDPRHRANLNFIFPTTLILEEDLT